VQIDKKIPIDKLTAGTRVANKS